MPIKLRITILALTLASNFVSVGTAIASTANCKEAGGILLTDSENQDYCKFSNAEECPKGWRPHRNFTTTELTSCSDELFCLLTQSLNCTTGRHYFSDQKPETCKIGLACQDKCVARVSEIGCRPNQPNQTNPIQ